MRRHGMTFAYASPPNKMDDDRNAGRAPGKHLTTTFGYDEVEVRGVAAAPVDNQEGVRQ